MFQYAFYLSLKEKFSDVKADVAGFESYNLHHGFELERVFDLALDKVSPFQSQFYSGENAGFAVRKLRQLLRAKKWQFLEREYFEYDPSLYDDRSVRYYWGYWQHLNYIKPIEETLRKHFTFKAELNSRNLELLESILKTDSIAVHVRRGDYTFDPLLGNICQLSYFNDAIDILRQTTKNPFFVVFSDDIDWCKKELLLDNCVYVDWNLGSASYVDLQLMSNCKHNILSNSTFGWWGGWLNLNPDKIVIAPGRWMNVDHLDYSGLTLPNSVIL